MVPKISIIVPIYNAEKYLMDSIKSILNQTFRDFELILVNDGSTDCSDEICKQFESIDNRITYVKKNNGGSSSAKNFGVAISKGKYIGFVDADDTIDDSYIENLFKGTTDEEVDLCVGNVAFKKQVNNQLETKKITIYPGIFTLQEYLKFYPEYMPHAIIGAPWNKLFKRDIIIKNQLKFDENLKNNEDTQFNYSYLEKCRKIYVSSSPYYNYMNWGDKSASRGYIEDIFYIYLSTYRKAKEFLKNVEMYDCNEEFTKRYFINLVLGAINNIVIGAPYNILGKKRMIRDIVFEQEVQRAVADLQYADIKRKVAILLIKRKKVNLLYGLFALNNMRLIKYLKGR